jgi:hypothetical protein
VRLLVKEHPLMVAARPASFYDELRGLPNVEMAHSSLSTHALVATPQCRATVVVSSSVGFEAAMNGCPVVALAPMQYALLPGVTAVRTVEEALAALQSPCLAGARVEAPDAESSRLAYLCAVLEHSLSFDYVERWNSRGGRFDARALVDAIHKRLGGPRACVGDEAATIRGDAASRV